MAWDVYHARGVPGWSWNESLTAHLHHGIVVSTDRVFVMARRVDAAGEDAQHLSPLQWRDGGDCLNIWIAAGDIGSFLRLENWEPTPWISFLRRDNLRVRRYQTAEIRRLYGIIISAKAKAPAASSIGDGRREGPSSP